MLLVMTDEDLNVRKQSLMEQKKQLQDQIYQLERTLDEMYITWRSEKDPIMKRKIHKDIFDLKDRIIFHPNKRKINRIDCEIFEINSMLKPSNYGTGGYFYTDTHDLDYHDIILHGIRGVKF